MTTDTAIYQLIRDVMNECGLGTANQNWVARDLLTSPFADILDFAAEFVDEMTKDELPAVWALLTDWQANR